jgi:transcriptional regulator with AAA-type ATPase domain
MNNSQNNLKAIRKVKSELKKVTVQDVADELKCSRNNIYKHLNEDRADKVSLPHLVKISAAIKKVIAKAEKQNQSALSKLVA